MLLEKLKKKKKNLGNAQTLVRSGVMGHLGVETWAYYKTVKISKIIKLKKKKKAIIIFKKIYILEIVYEIFT